MAELILVLCALFAAGVVILISWLSIEEEKKAKAKGPWKSQDTSKTYPGAGGDRVQDNYGNDM